VSVYWFSLSLLPPRRGCARDQPLPTSCTSFELSLRRGCCLCCLCWFKPLRIHLHEKLWCPWWHKAALFRKYWDQSCMCVRSSVCPSIHHSCLYQALFCLITYLGIPTSETRTALSDSVTGEPRKTVTVNERHFSAKANGTCSANHCAAFSFRRSHNLHIWS